MTFNSEDLEDLRNLFKDTLEVLLSNLNEMLQDLKEIPISTSYVQLEIESETLGGYRFHSVLSIEYLRNFFLAIQSNPELEPIFEKLNDFNSFVPNFNFANPQLSIFGNFFLNYISVYTDTKENENIKVKIPIQFNNEIFQYCLNKAIPWIINKPIEFSIYYPVLYSNIKGESFIIDEERQLKFIIPTIDDRKNLTKKIKIAYIAFEGPNVAMARLSWIQFASAWIEGKIEIPSHFLKENFPKLDLLYPKDIQESLVFLGAHKCFVGYFISNDFYSVVPMFINPISDGRATISKQFFQYPGWMNNQALLLKFEEIEIDDFGRKFILFYQKMRKNIPRNSFENLVIDRFLRAVQINLLNDIILESVIGIESVVVSGSSDASLQFRLNCSWLLGNNFEERAKIERIAKNLYDLRSKIVHEGGELKILQNKIKELGGVDETAKIAKLLFQMIIIRGMMISDGELKFINRKKIQNILHDLRLGSENKLLKNDLYILLEKKLLDILRQKI